MKRILTFYIIREIASLFLLGIAVFTLILLMGRLIKLTDLVISRGVPLADISRMILYLMPSFLVFTIPMAFLLAVLLAFGRLSADNEITVMKSGGLSLVQIMPPVLLCGVVAVLLTLAASIVGVPWGNSAFKRISFEMLKQNVAVTIREKVFWDEIPGIILYTDHYDEQSHTLKGVVIHDGRDQARPMTIFAASGNVGCTPNQQDICLVLNNGSIHAAGKGDGYRLVNFGEYAMTVAGPGKGGGIGRNELDMGIGELRQQIDNPATPKATRLKMAAELQSRFAFPFASLVFAVVAVPLGIQNRRSGKSAGFSVSIAILLAYYVLLSLLRTLAERGTLPAELALWLPNVIFLAVGWHFLRMASLERSIWTAVQNVLLTLIGRRNAVR
ncbi:LPS export ABC transporter permease LptF [Oryzomonas japonica]|uniref:LPS export ABC transporter permease LptF n=1 Tax=Oryzomonas japonica TaxID=2603858 RepID=A0A7J4ZSK2_9BACT|nr:LPS export ABC transporter permease LptF [Oryzomonas japonica]KAB0666268.1 LPS export ABC transporter permease LptF [Oryzomonas japonica]